MADLWLVLETSGRGGQIGLFHGEQGWTASLDPTRRHNRDLVSTIETLLNQAGQTLNQLTGVMVSVGPGSFTGLRVGIMSAKMLAYARGCQLIAVPTFAAIALQSPPECLLVDVLSDGLQKLIYVQRFQREADGQFQPITDLQIVAIQSWAEQLPADCWLSGPAVSLVENAVPPGQPRVPLPDQTVQLNAIYQTGLRLKPLSHEAILQLEPLYLRPSSAEEQANRKRLGS